VVGEFEDMRIEAPGIQVFQGLGNLLVQTLTPRRNGPVVKHLADQRMGELEHLPLAQEYALLHALFQQAQYLILMRATHRAKELYGEAIA